MRNDVKSKIEEILSKASKLPYFNLDDLVGFKKNKRYLKTSLFRYAKSGNILRIKKGFYVTKKYISDMEKKGKINGYSEFISLVLTPNSYLSLDYILYKNGILTEAPNNITCISNKKTSHFSNEFGSYFFHKIKSQLFCGFKNIKKDGYIINEASAAKALFDFLYLRKNILSDGKSVEELRLNTELFTKKDISEFKKYIKIENSKKMIEISKNIFK